MLKIPSYEGPNFDTISISLTSLPIIDFIDSLNAIMHNGNVFPIVPYKSNLIYNF